MGFRGYALGVLKGLRLGGFQVSFAGFHVQGVGAAWLQFRNVGADCGAQEGCTAIHEESNHGDRSC